MNKANTMFEKLAISEKLLRRAADVARRSARQELREGSNIVKHLKSRSLPIDKEFYIGPMKQITKRIEQNKKFKDAADFKAFQSSKPGKLTKEDKRISNNIMEGLRKRIGQKDIDDIGKLLGGQSG